MQVPLKTFGAFLRFHEKRAELMDYARAICKHKTITSLRIDGFDDDEMLLIAQHLNKLDSINISSIRVTFEGLRRFLETATSIKKATFSGFLYTDDDEDDFVAIDKMVRDRGIKLSVRWLECDVSRNL